MPTALLALVTPGDRRRVLLSKQDDLVSPAWAPLRWELDDVVLADEGDSWILDGPSLFANLQNFIDASRRAGIGIDLDADVRVLVAEFVAEAKTRRSAQNGETPPLADDELEQRLTGSRVIRELTQNQRRDLAMLLSLRNGANFSVPGAGKTTVALALYDLERAEGRVDRLFVIGPKNAFLAWEEEAPIVLSGSPTVTRLTSAAQFLQGDALGEIVLCTYQRLPRVESAIRDWLQANRVHLILDEAHRIKRGWRGVHGRAVLQLAPLAARRDILTGTPMPQAAADVVPQLAFLWPSQEAEIVPTSVYDDPPSEEALTELRSRIEPLYCRTTKAELQLPPLKISVEPIKLSGYQQDIYSALRGELRQSWLALPERERWDFQNLGRYWVYLVEAAVNPSLLMTGAREGDDLPLLEVPPLPVRPGTTLWELLQEYNLRETPAKLARVAEVVRDFAPTRKVLIWTNFVTNCEVVAELLREYRPAVVHGGIPSIEVASPTAERVRETEIRRFKEDPDCRVFVGNPAACAEGISLHQVCHDAFYLDRTFNAGHYMQSVDRIHRLGLAPSVETRATIFQAVGTIDSRIGSRLDSKIRRMARVLDDAGLTTLAMDAPDEGGDEGAVPEDIRDWEDAKAVVEELEEED